MIACLTEGVRTCQCVTNSRRVTSSRHPSDKPSWQFSQTPSRRRLAPNELLVQFPPSPRLSSTATSRLAVTGNDETPSPEGVFSFPYCRPPRRPCHLATTPDSERRPNPGQCPANVRRAHVSERWKRLADTDARSFLRSRPSYRQPLSSQAQPLPPTPALCRQVSTHAD